MLPTNTARIRQDVNVARGVAQVDGAIATQKVEGLVKDYCVVKVPLGIAVVGRNRLDLECCQRTVHQRRMDDAQLPVHGEPSLEEAITTPASVEWSGMYVPWRARP